MASMSYPDYIDHGLGLPVTRGPYLLKDAKMTTLFLKADYQQLEAVCNKYINDPLGNAPIQYRPLLPYVILAYTDLTIRSLDEEARKVGWLPEIELSFWILTVALKRDGDLWLPDHLAWYQPYLFVDDADAIATGREVYGFRKVIGQFQPVTDFQSPEFMVETLAFKTFSPETEGKMQWLLKVTRQAEPAQGEPVQWDSGSAAHQAILRLLAGNETGHVEVDWLEEAINLFEHFIEPEVPIVLLKQFRDATNPWKACYQAIIETPAKLNAFYKGGLLQAGKYLVSLNDLASHPLAQELGLQMEQGQQEAIPGFWVNIDFTLEDGTEIWSNTASSPAEQSGLSPGPGAAGAKTLPPASGPQKIAILGGGVGSLSAAFALTDQPGWQEKYEITVYQLGWRLGGKGASGRRHCLDDRDANGCPYSAGDRIEEHGIHVWFGCYDNAFRVIQKCYQELGRPPGTPLATWDEAFKPHNFVVVEEFYNNQWQHWPFDFSPNDLTPGQGEGFLSPWEYLKEILNWMVKHFMNLPQAQTSTTRPGSPQPPGCLGRLLGRVGPEVTAVGVNLAADLLTQAHRHAHSLHPEAGNHTPEQHQALTGLLKDFRAAVRELVKADLERDNELRRTWIMLELGIINGLGMLADGVLVLGYDVIDGLDYREWLIKHGASDEVAYSAPVRAYYDAAFAYPYGDTGDPNNSHNGNMGAGTMLRVLMRTLFSYRGAIMWKMQAGMGDAVFTPLYQVLKKRGVKFEFFCKVTSLQPGSDGTIDQILFNRQVTLKKGLAEYNPLVDINGLPCWPSQPLYDQLEQGQALREQQINLESYWTPWQEVEQNVPLIKGKDFDLVVLGISLGALPDICAKLKVNPKWQAMFDNVLTVQTLAMQVWLKSTLEKLGWSLDSPISDAYAQPFNSWADMAQTLPAENWPTDLKPLGVAYFCGLLKDAAIIPPYSDHNFPDRESQRVKQIALDWLQRNIGHLWPDAVSAGGFNWDDLIDPKEGQGQSRFDSQFWRANIDPTERYVLSVKGSSTYRLKTDESGFGNLYLVGDWIKNGLNVGAVESAVTAGLQASRAISGYPQQIPGEHDEVV
jgi:uncharacterized protein with NAD-binding domain and iron-sulfur cluster